MQGFGCDAAAQQVRNNRLPFLLRTCCRYLRLFQAGLPRGQICLDPVTCVLRPRHCIGLLTCGPGQVTGAGQGGVESGLLEPEKRAQGFEQPIRSLECVGMGRAGALKRAMCPIRLCMRRDPVGPVNGRHRDRQADSGCGRIDLRCEGLPPRVQLVQSFRGFLCARFRLRLGPIDLAQLAEILRLYEPSLHCPIHPPHRCLELIGACFGQRLAMLLPEPLTLGLQGIGFGVGYHCSATREPLDFRSACGGGFAVLQEGILNLLDLAGNGVVIVASDPDLGRGFGTDRQRVECDCAPPKRIQRGSELRFRRLDGLLRLGP